MASAKHQCFVRAVRCCARRVRRPWYRPSTTELEQSATVTDATGKSATFQALESESLALAVVDSDDWHISDDMEGEEDEETVSLRLVLLSGEVVEELSLPVSVLVGDVRHYVARKDAAVSRRVAGAPVMELQLLCGERILQDDEVLGELGLPSSPAVATLHLIRVEKTMPYRILICGQSGTGKTSLFERFIDDTYRDLYEETNNIDSASRTLFVRLGNGGESRRVQLEVIDSAGEEWCRRGLHVYYRRASAIMVVFDLTNRDSFLNLYKWLDHISEERGDVTICLVGAKCDCAQQRTVSKDEGLRFAAMRGHMYQEVSAKYGLGVEDAFDMLAMTLLTRSAMLRSVEGIPSYLGGAT